jgi:hypothetical protein
MSFSIPNTNQVFHTIQNFKLYQKYYIGMQIKYFNNLSKHFSSTKISSS